MMRAESMSQSLRFDVFTVDGTKGGIWRDDLFVPLRPKIYSLLVFFAENPSRIVTKDEIVEAVWPGIFVTDESVAKSVSELRAALGTAGHRLLKTAPKRGYIFESNVLSVDDNSYPKHAAALPATDTARKRVEAKWIAATITALGILFAVVFYSIPKNTPFSTPIPSIAVLPFAEVGNRAQRGYFGDGLAEDLTVSLGKFSELFVVAQGSSLRYAPTESPQTVGQALGARYLVRGSVRRVDDRLRVTAELIEVASNRQIWGQQYDRPGTDLFRIQEELAEKIVTTLVTYVSRSELDRVSKKGTANLDAYDFYLKGNAVLRARNGARRGEMVMSARRLFEQALNIDPSYAPAMDGLAYTYTVGFLERTDHDPLASEFGRTEILGRALSLARSALALDPYRAETHVTAAWTLHWLYRRSEALSEFERALELNPNLVDGRFTHMLVHMGRSDDAIAYMQRVMKHDPFPSPIYLSYLGNAYYERGEYDRAYHTLKDGFDAIPGYRPLAVWLAASLAQLGMAEEAKPLVQEVLMGTPEFSTNAWINHIRFANLADAERLAAGMKKAGFPD
jgi:adenylate cyclase